MHKKMLYHVFGGNLCCLQNFQLLGNAPPLPERRNFTSNLMMWYSSTGMAIVVMVFFL